MKAQIKLIVKLASVALCLLAFLSVSIAHAQKTGAKPAPSSPQTGGNQSPSTTQTPNAPLDLKVKAQEREVDDTISNDPATEALIKPYSAKVRELEKPLAKLDGDLKKSGMGGGSLGNFVVDALRAEAQKKLGRPVILTVVNTSGLRKNSIAAGNIAASDIYELLPFDNALITLDLTGEQLRRFMDINVARGNAQSGARVRYRNNKELKKNEIVSLKLGDTDEAAKEIDPKATYTIVTIDYLVNRGGDYSVLKEGKNLRPLGLTMRDALLDYAKAEAAAGRNIKTNLDGRFSYERVGSDKSEGESPQ